MKNKPSTLCMWYGEEGVGECATTPNTGKDSILHRVKDSPNRICAEHAKMFGYMDLIIK